MERPAPTVFVGDGHSPQWRDLADHLRDQHELRVIAFETGPRAGLTTQEVLDGIVEGSHFAVLVHTAEDETADGTLRARQNVVHETGLLQGRLGRRRALILRETSCEDFSNVHGVTEIRFPDGHIREVFGDVVATIRREFDG